MLQINSNVVVVPPFECAWLEGCNKGCISFEAKGENDVTVILKATPGSKRLQPLQRRHSDAGDHSQAVLSVENNYTVILGSHRNSCLKFEKNGVTFCMLQDAPGSQVTGKAFKQYWINYDDGAITVGCGAPGSEPYYTWRDPSDPIPGVHFFGLSSWDCHVSYRNVQVLPALDILRMCQPATENDVPSLFSICKCTLLEHITPHNVCGIIQAAELLLPLTQPLYDAGLEQLARSFLDVVSEHGISEQFCRLSETTLTNVLRHTCLSVNEDRIFDAVATWALSQHTQYDEHDDLLVDAQGQVPGELADHLANNLSHDGTSTPHAPCSQATCDMRVLCEELNNRRPAHHSDLPSNHEPPSPFSPQLHATACSHVYTHSAHPCKESKQCMQTRACTASCILPAQRDGSPGTSTPHLHLSPTTDTASTHFLAVNACTSAPSLPIPGVQQVLMQMRFPLIPPAKLQTMLDHRLMNTYPLIRALVLEALEATQQPNAAKPNSSFLVENKRVLKQDAHLLQSCIRYQMRSLPHAQELLYVSDGDRNGVLYYIATQGGAQPWLNPVLSKQVVVKASSPTSRYTDPKAIVAGQFVRTSFAGPRYENGVPVSWWMVDLGSERTLVCNYYSMRHDASHDFARSWVFQGSVDLVNWVTLREHVGDKAFRMPGQYGSWPVFGASTNAPYRAFRVMLTGPTCSDTRPYNLCLSNIELYGYLIGAT